MATEIGRGATAAKGEPAVGDLVREALGDTRELVRLEVALAREDLRGELATARTSAVAIALAFALVVMALTMFVVAIVLALAVGWVGALVAGGVLLLLAVALGLVGWKAMPTRPLGDTRGRILWDVKHLKEGIA
jgi:Putative Actinobacterial Holin-X, holin superfamily III